MGGRLARVPAQVFAVLQVFFEAPRSEERTSARRGDSLVYGLHGFAPRRAKPTQATHPGRTGALKSFVSEEDGFNMRGQHLCGT
jgi:hypothetical protein